MSRKTRIAIALSVFGVIVVIIVVVAIILYLSIVTVSTDHYALLYKKGEKRLLKSNKTYESGMKWVGMGNSFHQFENRHYQLQTFYETNVSDIVYCFSFNASVRLIKSDLYLTWYSLYGVPANVNVEEATNKAFLNFVNQTDPSDITSNDPDVIMETNKKLCEGYGDILKTITHLQNVTCGCTHLEKYPKH